MNQPSFELLATFSKLTAGLSIILLVGGLLGVIGGIAGEAPAYAIPLGAQAVAAGVGGWMFGLIGQAVANIASRV